MAKEQDIEERGVCEGQKNTINTIVSIIMSVSSACYHVVKDFVPVFIATIFMMFIIFLENDTWEYTLLFRLILMGAIIHIIIIYVKRLINSRVRL